MSKISGTLVLFDFDGSKLAHIDNVTWNSSFSLAEAADKDSEGYQEYLENAGLREASMDINGNADFEYASGNQKKLAQALKSRSNFDFVFGPSAANNLNFTGSCLINDHSIDAPNEETTTFSATAPVNGKWLAVETS